MPNILLQNVYRTLFWIGYLAVLITTFIPIKGTLNKITFGLESFQIRLDHLLHFAFYFLICMYFLAGQRRELILFNSKPLLKFILLIFILATVTELVQLWVPERAFNPLDWMANVAGIVVGVGIIKVTERLWD